MTSTSAEESPASLTSHNLMRLGRVSSLAPAWEPPDASQYLSSGASSSRRPMKDRITFKKRQVHYFMDLLTDIKPEGWHVVLESEIQFDGKDSVRFKTDAVPRPAVRWDVDWEVLAFWKRKRHYFKEKLFQITKERFGTPPITIALSELQADHRMTTAYAERQAQLPRMVETWLCNIPPGT